MYKIHGRFWKNGLMQTHDSPQGSSRIKFRYNKTSLIKFYHKHQRYVRKKTRNYWIILERNSNK